MKSSGNNFIFLPVFYLIMWVLKASENFGKIADAFSGMKKIRLISNQSSTVYIKHMKPQKLGIHSIRPQFFMKNSFVCQRKYMKSKFKSHLFYSVSVNSDLMSPNKKATSIEIWINLYTLTRQKRLLINLARL